MSLRMMSYTTPKSDRVQYSALGRLKYCSVCADWPLKSTVHGVQCFLSWFETTFPAVWGMTTIAAQQKNLLNQNDCNFSNKYRAYSKM